MANNIMFQKKAESDGSSQQCLVDGSNQQCPNEGSSQQCPVDGSSQQCLEGGSDQRCQDEVSRQGSSLNNLYKQTIHMLDSLKNDSRVWGKNCMRLDRIPNHIDQKIILTQLVAKRKAPTRGFGTGANWRFKGLNWNEKNK